MPLFPEKYRLLVALSLLLLIGFLTTSLVSYFNSRHDIRVNIAEYALPQTSDNIYSEIQKDILRPIFISSMMAHDTFLKDWVLDGEKDITAIARYLEEIKNKYNMKSSDLVSEKTRNYYYGNGILKQVNEAEHRDIWYFRVQKMEPEYEINVDIDMANNDAITIFVNYRLLDYQGNFIGTTGVGVTLDSLAQLIKAYETRFHRTIYFTDDKGNIVLSRQPTKGQSINLDQVPGIDRLKGRILNHDNTPTQLFYSGKEGRTMVSSRYIPELNWYLVVTQDEAEQLASAQHVLFLNLAIAFFISLLVLLLAWLTIQHFQKRLEKMATYDVLTGCLNRQAFEIVMSHTIAQLARKKQTITAILIDIDHFKHINDTHGHLTGDKVLQEFVSHVQTTLRKEDAMARWGGEEFLILLPDCPLEIASARAEVLREFIANQSFANGKITLSAAVAEYQTGEGETSFFFRLDKALYRAKSLGRNRVELAQIC